MYICSFKLKNSTSGLISLLIFFSFLKRTKFYFQLERVGIQDVNNLKRFLIKNKPLKTDVELVRLGSDYDGGYLISNDLKNIKYCYSPGVSNNSDFEFDLFNRFEIKSFLCDFSVDGPPIKSEGFKFLKKYLSSHTDEINTTLSDWILNEKNDNV